MTQGTVACQAPLSMEFPRQYWSQLPCPLQGIFSTQGSNPHLLHWQAHSLPLSHKSPYIDHYISINIINTTDKKILKKNKQTTQSYKKCVHWQYVWAELILLNTTNKQLANQHYPITHTSDSTVLQHFILHGVFH